MFTMYEIETHSTLWPCPDMLLLEKGGGSAVAVVMYGLIEGSGEREEGFKPLSVD